MISVIEGRPGQGKTLYGVDRIFGGLENKHTFVASNIEIIFEKNDNRKNRFKQLSVATTIEDILAIDLKMIYDTLKMKRILLVIDECQTIMNSRRWEDMPPEFEFFLQQHRHYRFDIIGLTQSIKRADAVMRELVQYFFRLTKIFTVRLPYKLGSFGFFLKTEYDPDSIESSTKKYEKIGFGFPTIFFASPFICKMYDTYQEFPILSREGLIETRTYLHTKTEKIQPRLITKTFEQPT